MVGVRRARDSSSLPCSKHACRRLGQQPSQLEKTLFDGLLRCCKKGDFGGGLGLVASIFNDDVHGILGSRDHVTPRSHPNATVRAAAVAIRWQSAWHEESNLSSEKLISFSAVDCPNNCPQQSIFDPLYSNFGHLQSLRNGVCTGVDSESWPCWGLLSSQRTSFISKQDQKKRAPPDQLYHALYPYFSFLSF